MTDDPMACRVFVELVTDYLEGALDAQTRLLFDEHLAECDGCTAYLDQLRRTIATTAAIGEDDLDPVFREKLLMAFRDWS